MGAPAAGRSDGGISALSPERRLPGQNRAQEAADGAVGNSPGPVVAADQVGRAADAQAEDGHA